MGSFWAATADYSCARSIDMPEGGKAFASARGASAADVVAASGLPVAPPGPIGPYTVGVEILQNSQLFICKQMFLFLFTTPTPRNQCQPLLAIARFLSSTCPIWSLLFVCFDNQDNL